MQQIQEKDHATALHAVRECRRNLELIAKLTGELKPRRRPSLAVRYRRTATAWTIASCLHAIRSGPSRQHKKAASFKLDHIISNKDKLSFYYQETKLVNWFLLYWARQAIPPA